MSKGESKVRVMVDRQASMLGFQECSANRIALVDDDDVQYMMKTLHK